MKTRNPRQQISVLELAAQVRCHSIGNRDEVEASRHAECLSCLAHFNSRDVVDWHDEWDCPKKQNRVKRWSAKCPKCAAAIVIGDASGLLKDQSFAVMAHTLLGLCKH
jgi:hypothetical protein